VHGLQQTKARRLAMIQDNQDHVVAGPEAHQVFVDISSIKHRSDKKTLTSKPYWLLMVVEQVNFKISEFLSRKKEMPIKVLELNIKYVRLVSSMFDWIMLVRIKYLQKWLTAIPGTYNWNSNSWKQEHCGVSNGGGIWDIVELSACHVQCCTCP
jgi:hypothetical protein